MLYKSPIEIIHGDLVMKIENEIATAIQKYDIVVDRDELLRALKYDRDQYNRGFNDGIMAAADELVRCKDCEHRRDDEDYASGHYCVKRPSNGGYFCEDDDFCSYGERRDDNA